MSQTKDYSAVFQELVQGLSKDDLSDVDPEALAGGGEALIEIVVERVAGEDISVETWGSLFESLSSDHQEDLLFRLAGTDQWNDELLEAATDNDWVGGSSVNSLFIRRVFEGDQISSDTAVDFFEHVQGFDSDRERRINRALISSDRTGNDVSEDEMIALGTALDDPAEGLKQLFQANKLDLAEAYEDEFGLVDLKAPLEYWVKSWATYSMEAAEFMMKKLNFPAKDWKNYLRWATDSTSPSQAFLAVYARKNDPDQRFLNDCLHKIFYNTPGVVDRQKIDVILEEGAEPTTHHHYGEWLIEDSDVDNKAKRFRNWLNEGGEANMDVIRLAFSKGNPEIITALQGERNLEQSVMHSTVQDLLYLDEEQRDIGREVGIIQVLEDKYLKSPNGEPSYFLELLSNIARTPEANYEPLGQALFERKAGGPQFDEEEIPETYRGMVAILKQDRSYEQWLCTIAATLIDQGFAPPEQAAEQLQEQSPHFERMLDEHLGQRAQNALNIRTNSS